MGNNQIVFIENGKAVTDSLTVAEVFGKDHDKVIRDINNQIEKLNEAGEGAWGVANFGETHYQHQQNKQWYKKYILTEEAFTLVAFAYITPEAMKMKVKFIQEFKRMRETLQTIISPSYMIDDPIIRAKRWIQEHEEKQVMEQQLQLVAPMVEKYEQFIDSEGLMDMKSLAKIVGWGRNTLFAFLRENKILMKDNAPYQSFMNRGYFKLKTKPTYRGIVQVTLVTPKGADYIADLVNKAS